MSAIQSRYSGAIVYKLVHRGRPSKFYIGSTTMTLEEKMLLHKNESLRPLALTYNIVLYSYIRNHGGMKNFDIEVLERGFPCTCWGDIMRREHHYIMRLTPALNTYLP